MRFTCTLRLGGADDRNLLSDDMSSLTGGVDYTVPIGQVDYISAITKIREKKAVSINLMAHPGCE